MADLTRVLTQEVKMKPKFFIFIKWQLIYVFEKHAIENEWFEKK